MCLLCTAALGIGHWVRIRNSHFDSLPFTSLTVAAKALAAKSSSAAEGLAALLRAIVDAKARANPAAWRRHVAPSGGAFYVYVSTGETSWSLPRTVRESDVENGDADTILIEE